MSDRRAFASRTMGADVLITVSISVFFIFRVKKQTSRAEAHFSTLFRVLIKQLVEYLLSVIQKLKLTVRISCPAITYRGNEFFFFLS